MDEAIRDALGWVALEGLRLSSDWCFDWPRAVQETVHRLRLSLHAPNLPIFAAVVGGASSGKSTVFNNLLDGHLASRITARGHATLGLILAAHEDNRHLVEELLADDLLLPGLQRVDVELNGNVCGKPDGLGVLFFMQGNLHGELAMEWPEIIDISRKKNNAVVYVPAKERRRNSRRKYRQLIQEYKDALLEVVGDYGHTLRTIKSTAYVVVAINFRHASWGEDVPKRMIMKIKKRDLDRYNRGDISFSQFKRKVVFNEYQ